MKISVISIKMKFFIKKIVRVNNNKIEMNKSLIKIKYYNN